MRPLQDLVCQKKMFLWDFDGCFCDTEGFQFQAYAKAFADEGHFLDEADFYERFTHLGLGAQSEIELHGLDCSVQSIRAAKEKYYAQFMQAGQMQLFAQIPSILSALHKLNIKSAIVSNTPRDVIENILARTDKKVEIDHIFGLQAGLAKKPSPDLYLYALSQLQLKTKDVFIVEDSERGLEAAFRANCDALWIETPYSKKFDTKIPYVDKISHAKLLQILNTAFLER